MDEKEESSLKNAVGRVSGNIPARNLRTDVGDLEDMCDVLDSAITELADRLAPVTLPATPQNAEKAVGATTPSYSDLSSHLVGVKSRLRMLRERLYDLRERLDI